METQDEQQPWELALRALQDQTYAIGRAASSVISSAEPPSGRSTQIEAAIELIQTVNEDELRTTLKNLDKLRDAWPSTRDDVLVNWTNKLLPQAVTDLVKALNEARDGARNVDTQNTGLGAAYRQYVFAATASCNLVSNFVQEQWPRPATVKTDIRSGEGYSYSVLGIEPSRLGAEMRAAPESLRGQDQPSLLRNAFQGGPRDMPAQASLA